MARTGNAGAYIVTGTLGSVTAINTSLFSWDNSSEGLAIPPFSDKGCYNCNITTHIIYPIAGKIIVLRTHDGHYAKFEILNYYENGKQMKI